MSICLDTNIIIYLQKGLIIQPLPVAKYFISVITEIELLSFPGIEVAQRQQLERFFENITILTIDSTVKKLAIDVRHQYRLKLPDAIIIATTMSQDALLLTNDQRLLTVPGVRAQSVEIRHQ